MTANISEELRARMLGAELSKRERELLGYIVLGKTNEEIAQIVGIAPLTVKNFVGKILAKLGAISRTAVAWTAIKEGYVVPPTPDTVMPEIRPTRLVVRQPLPVAVNPLKVLTYGHFELCEEDHSALYMGKPLKLTAPEFKLLFVFLSNPGRTMNRQQLLDHSHGQHVEIEEQTINIYVSRLRLMLATVNAQGCIQTVRGLGYRFVPPKDFSADSPPT